jgi:hypothetical protein
VVVAWGCVPPTERGRKAVLVVWGDPRVGEIAMDWAHWPCIMLLCCRAASTETLPHACGSVSVRAPV